MNTSFSMELFHCLRDSIRNSYAEFADGNKREKTCIPTTHAMFLCGVFKNPIRDSAF